MGRVALGLALGAVLAGAPLAAQESRHPALDALVARAEAADPNADPVAYHANFVAALDEARKYFAAGSPEMAERELGVATGLAAQQKFAEAAPMLARLMPVLEANQPAFRKGLMDALSLQGYIATFTGDHATSVSAMGKALALQREMAGGTPSVELAKAIANLGAVLREAGDPATALRYNTEALAMLPALDPPPPDGALWYANRAAYLRELGRDDEAIATSYEGLGYAEKALPQGHPLIANLYANLGMLLIRQGRPTAALPLTRKAFEMTEAAAGGPNQNSATMRAIFATALVQAGRFAEGAAFLEQAIPLIDAQLGPESNRALQAREALARTLLRLGRLDEARDLEIKVMAARDARLAPGHVGRMEARQVLGSIELARGDARAAEAVLAEGVALRAAAMPASHPDLLAERSLLLLARSRAGSTGGDALAAEARGLLAALENAANLSSSGLSVALRFSFGHLAEVLARAGDDDAAFEAQQWSARTSVDDAAIAAEIARLEAAGGSATTLLDERRRLIVERTSLLASAEAQVADPKDEFDVAQANERIDALTAQIAASEGAIAAGGGAVPRFAALDLAAVSRALGPGEAFLQVNELRDGFIVTAATAEQSWQYLVPDSEADLRGLAARLRKSLDPARAREPFDRKAAAAIYASLVRPDVARGLARVTELKVSANGALGAVPFAILVPDAAKGDYLIDRVAITRLPGVPRGAGRDRAPPSPRLVALGDVGGLDGAEGEAALRGGRTLDLAALPRLPGAAAELDEIARVLGARDPVILTGGAATEEALRQAEITPGSVLAFATHGLVSGEIEGLREPALVLTAEGDDDGLLTASEIARLDLPARWVLLSACNTAAGAGPDAPGLSGLAQAFMMAGAEEILATHWPVRDDMARLVATGTLRAAAAGEAPARALRQSMLAARASGRPQATHPALWGAFELVE